LSLPIFRISEANPECKEVALKKQAFKSDKKYERTNHEVAKYDSALRERSAIAPYTKFKS